MSPNPQRHVRSQQTPPAGHGSPLHPNEYPNNSLAAPNPSTSLRRIAKPVSVGWRTSPPPLHDCGDRLHYRDPSAVPRWGGSAHPTARRGALGAQLKYWLPKPRRGPGFALRLCYPWGRSTPLPRSCPFHRRGAAGLGSHLPSWTELASRSLTS